MSAPAGAPTVLDVFIECLEVVKQLQPRDRVVCVEALANFSRWSTEALRGTETDWQAKAEARGKKVSGLEAEVSELQAEVEQLQETLAEWCAEHEPDDEDEPDDNGESSRDSDPGASS